MHFCSHFLFKNIHCKVENFLKIYEHAELAEFSTQPLKSIQCYTLRLDELCLFN